MFQARVAIHECASITLTIENFSQVTDDYREILFSPPSNTKIIFDFGLFPRGTFATPNWFNDDVLSYLWFRVVDRDRITIKYKVSILGEDGQKCYTQGELGSDHFLEICQTFIKTLENSQYFP